MRVGRALSTGAIVVLLAGALVAADPGKPTTPAQAAPADPPAAATVIAGGRAGDYVGQEVTVEGRVVAIHESPLATVVAFSPNFAGFTATIQAADRDAFPADLETRIRDHVVRVSGTVTAYRGKPEMTLRDPSQLVLAPPPAPGAVAARPAAPAASPDASGEELRRALARIESRLASVEERLDALEQAESAAAGAVPPPHEPARSSRASRGTRGSAR